MSNTSDHDTLRARVDQVQALATAAPAGPWEWSIYAGRHPVRLCTESQFQADAGYLLQLDIDRIPRTLAGLTDLLAAAPDLAVLVTDLAATADRYLGERNAACGARDVAVAERDALAVELDVAKADLAVARAVDDERLQRAVRAEAERDALANRQVVVVCAEHGDELSATWENDDGDLLVTVEPCPLCARDRFDAGRRAAGRNP